MSPITLTLELQPIPGLPEYFATKEGSIYRLNARYLRSVTQRLDDLGHWRFSFEYSGGSPRGTLRVARAVCLAFHGSDKPPRTPILFKDGDFNNCHRDNLRWST